MAEKPSAAANCSSDSDEEAEEEEVTSDEEETTVKEEMKINKIKQNDKKVSSVRAPSGERTQGNRRGGGTFRLDLAY